MIISHNLNALKSNYTGKYSYKKQQNGLKKVQVVCMSSSTLMSSYEGLFS